MVVIEIEKVGSQADAVIGAARQLRACAAPQSSTNQSRLQVLRALPSPELHVIIPRPNG